MAQQELTPTPSSSSNLTTSTDEPNEQQGKEKKELPPELHCEWLKFMPTPNAIQCLPKLGREIYALKRIELKKKWMVWQTLCLRYNRAHYEASVVPNCLKSLAIRTAKIRGEWTPMIEAITKSVKSRIDEVGSIHDKHEKEEKPPNGDEEDMGDEADNNDPDVAAEAGDEPEQPAQLLLQHTFRNKWRMDLLKSRHDLVFLHDSDIKYEKKFLANRLSVLEPMHGPPKFNKTELSEELLARLEAQYHSWGTRKIRKKMQPILESWHNVSTNWYVKLAECKAAIAVWQYHLDGSRIDIDFKNLPSTDPEQPGTSGSSGSSGTLNGNGGITQKRKYCPVLTCAQVDEISKKGYATKRRRRMRREEGLEEEEENEDEEEVDDDEDEEDRRWQIRRDELLQRARQRQLNLNVAGGGGGGHQLQQPMPWPLPPPPPLNQGMAEDEEQEEVEADYDQDEEVEYLGFC